MQTLTITRPDDMHLHVRDGAAMASVVGHSARQFGRAIIMPNLKPPIVTCDQAYEYQGRILDALAFAQLDDGEPETSFQGFPLMTLYLTDNTSPDEILAARKGNIVACKYYPAGATTNSAAGVTDIIKCYKVLEAMERYGMPLLMHGEVTDPTVDIFEREEKFIHRVLIPLRHDFPELKIVMEHITTMGAVEYVRRSDKFVAATITAQHLLLSRNAIFLNAVGATGLYPHNFCLPVLKHEKHRLALVRAATSGNPKFFLGTDSAPHAAELKERTPSCAGCFTALSALELYAEVFDAEGALDKLEGFASFYGADFYDLPRNLSTVTLVKQPWIVPEEVPFGDTTLKPFFGGETLQWKLVD